MSRAPAARFLEDPGTTRCPEDRTQEARSLVEAPQSSNQLMSGFRGNCRAARGAATRCQMCGSPRLVHHAEIDALAIAPIDCDRVLRQRRKMRPPGAARPTGDRRRDPRGVVAAACDVARTFGIRSALPMLQARRLCPHAVIIPPDMDKYLRVGREVRRLMLKLTALVEPLSNQRSLDRPERHHAPARSLAGQIACCLLRRAWKPTLALLCRSDSRPINFLPRSPPIDKPRGFAVLGANEARAFLAPKPVTSIWGVGAAMQARLARDGITVIAELAGATEADLKRRYRAEELRLSRLSRGLDARPVTPEREAKSIAAQATFEQISRRFVRSNAAVAGVQKGVGAAQGGRPCRLWGHAHAQDRGVQTANKEAGAWGSDQNSPPNFRGPAAICRRARPMAPNVV